MTLDRSASCSQHVLLICVVWIYVTSTHRNLQAHTLPLQAYNFIWRIFSWIHTECVQKKKKFHMTQKMVLYRGTQTDYVIRIFRGFVFTGGSYCSNNLQSGSNNNGQCSELLSSQFHQILATFLINLLNLLNQLKMKPHECLSSQLLIRKSQSLFFPPA